MLSVTRIFTVNRTAPRLFDYLADFTHTEVWDPGTISTTRLDDGPLGAGSRFANRSRFMGRTTKLEYTLSTYEPSTRLVFTGRNRGSQTSDDFTLRSTGSATEITYCATFVFSGLARVAEPFLRSPLDSLADKTIRQLREALGKT